jgi:hypothetical protein
LKPGFFTNERLADCQPLARILFQGLWVLADREGRLEDRPRKIKAEVLPFDTCDPDQLLDELQRHGFIARYAARGMQVIQVLAFAKHQRPHANEAQSQLPALEESTSHQGSKDFALYPSSLNPSSLNASCLNASDSSVVPEARPEPAVPPVSFPHDDASTSQDLAFPVVGKGKPRDGLWRPSVSQLAEWAAAYPDLDTLAEIRKARQWILAVDRRRKTIRGMPAFLVGWFNRAQNATPQRPGVATPPPMRQLVDIDSMEFCR